MLLQNPQTSPALQPRINSAVLVLLLAFLAFVYVFTAAAEWGDTPVYVADVLQASKTGEIAHLFEFGHLLWRPLGFLVYSLFPAPLWGSPQATASLGFLILNVLAGYIGGLLFFDIARLVSRSLWVAFLTAATFFCANAFLNWSQAGTAYVPGLTLLTMACWILLRAVYAGNLSGWKVIAAGLFLALSALTWFPYLTVASGAAAILLFLNTSRTDFRARLGWTVLLTLVSGLTVALVLGLAIRLHGFTSAAQVSAWIHDASHGVWPSNPLPRFVLGFPRSFVNMGADGMMFKRYLLHDPYAKISLLELVGVSLLRLVAFYLFLGFVFLRLATDPEGRPILWVFLFAAIPLIFFALVVFESSATERYLPIYPFLLMPIAFVLSRIRNTLLLGVMAGLMVLLSLSHLWIRSYIWTHKEDKPIVEALTELKSKVNEKSVVWALASADQAVAFSTSRVFHPLNLPNRFPVRQLILARTDRTGLWRKDFAYFSLEAINQGGTVWVSNHLLAPAPQRNWNWTEGDIPGVHWTDFPQFFKSLGLSESGGPPDGFSQLPTSPATLETLSAVSR